MKIRPLVYLIDDDAVINTVMIRRFEKLGCQAKSFTKSKDFYAEVDRATPDLFVVDLDLQDEISGFDIIRELKQKRKINVPILVVSGADDLEVTAKAIEIGADDFIVKPPLRISFKETVEQYLKRKTGEKQGKFRYIGSANSAIKISFPVEVVGLQAFGFTILADHLIKKGTLVTFSGEQLASFLPNCEKIMATVVNANMQIQGDKKQYEIQLEVDSAQTKVLEELHNFLSSKTDEEIDA